MAKPTTSPQNPTPWLALEAAETAIADATTPWDKAKGAGAAYTAVRGVLTDHELRLAALEAAAKGR